MADFTDRQNQIIGQSLRLIAEHGIESLTMRNLSKAVGISEPGCYRHFRDKSAILEGILRHYNELRKGLFREIRRKSPDSLAALQAVIVGHCELLEGTPALVTLLFPEEIRQNRKELRAGVLENMRFGQAQIMEIIAEGRQRGEIRWDVEPEQLALIIQGSLRLLVTAWRLNGGEPGLGKQAQELARTLLSLVRA